MDDDKKVEVSIGELRVIAKMSHRSSEVLGRVKFAKEILTQLDDAFATVEDIREYVLNQVADAMVEAIDAKQKLQEEQNQLIDRNKEN
jgi:3-oxoacyl-[acyl-carrier-protein] synthase III